MIWSKELNFSELWFLMFKNENNDVYIWRFLSILSIVLSKKMVWLSFLSSSSCGSNQQPYVFFFNLSWIIDWAQLSSSLEPWGIVWGHSSSGAWLWAGDPLGLDPLLSLRLSACCKLLLALQWVLEERAPRKKGKSCKAFCILASEFTWHHFCHILLVTGSHLALKEWKKTSLWQNRTAKGMWDGGITATIFGSTLCPCCRRWKSSLCRHGRVSKIYC